MISISDQMELFSSQKIVNWHEHVSHDENFMLNVEQTDALVNSAKRTHMDVLVCSRPMSGGSPTPEEFRKKNDVVAQAMKRHPPVIQGFAFVNPGYQKEAVAEIERCVKDLHFIGIKLYNQYFISDPVLHPVIEKCIELDIPILEHAGKLNQVPSPQPRISDGTHFALAAKKYPEATFLYAHIAGGGDWQWSLKAMADSPNVYTDISGSVYDERLIEMTVSAMGAQRVLFGTDGSFSQSIGRLLGANISEEQKRTILNNPYFERYLQRGYGV